MSTCFAGIRFVVSIPSSPVFTCSTPSLSEEALHQGIGCEKSANSWAITNRGRVMLKVGLIVGSTRPNRFADTPVQWLVEGASARPDLQLTVLDLRDYRLPFFNEP